MKKKTKLIIIVSLIIVFVFSIIGFLIYKNYDKNSFTVEENKWIDQNKNNLIDLYVLNDIPILNYNGEGLVFNFLTDFEKDVELKFNKISYKIDENIENKSSFKIVDKATKDDILVLRDNYVLITNNNITYNKVNDMNNLKIGILASDEAVIRNYYSDTNYVNQNIQFVNYDNYSSLINSLNTDNSGLNGIIVLKTLYTNNLIEKDKVKIAYQFTNLTKDYVLSIKDNDVLRSIIKKYYDTWSNKNFENKYNEFLLSQYYSKKNIDDIEQKKLQSKKYRYAFIENGIYDNLNNSKLNGINNLVLKKFANFTSISIEYKKYNSIDKLINDFNKEKIDLFFSNNSNTNYKIDYHKTSSVIDSQFVVLTNINNNIIINSLMSLKDEEVVTLKSSLSEQYLIDNNIKVKSYNNMKDLISNINKDDIILVDMQNYEYYKNKEFANTKIDYIFDLPTDYSYIIKNNEDNKVFANLFDFYVSYMSVESIISDGYNKVVKEQKSYYLLLIIIIIVLLASLITILYSKIKKMIEKIRKNKKINLTKEEKLKYIDQLTSLKNRAYLNDKIESWDDSEVYPQAIIIIDLNNIAYINDNYGHEEGDKVITEAANILILTQLPNTEIIRTDGNEFLIYLVGYDEKHIISYLRKLNREFKNLSHGFGAASGYSIIKNAIKNIDDAVNEATLDMRNNKEDIDY